MDKKTRLSLLLLLLFVWGVFLFIYKIRDIDISEPLRSSFLMRNLSWQTDFGESVPYKKWDELEYTAIFTSSYPLSLDISILRLRDILNITRIEFNERSIRESDLDSIDISESGILKIVGKAKWPSEGDIEARDAFDVTKQTPSEKEPIEGEKKDVENTGSFAPPSDLHLSATHFSANMPNLLVISGKNLSSVDIVNIGGTSFRPIASDAKLYVTIDRDAFATGEYFLFYQLKNGQIHTSDTKISFEYSDQKINIARITPDTLKNDQDRFVVVQGNGFDKIVSIQLSNNLILKNAEFSPISDHVVGVKIPKGLTPGEYYFNIMDTGSIYELKNAKFRVE